MTGVQTCALPIYIFVLDHGQVVESGTHTELVELGGQYSDLLRMQQQQQLRDASDEISKEG